MEDSRPESGVPLFLAAELEVLERLGHVVRYTPGSILFGEGEQTDFVLLIRRGHVKVQAGAQQRIVAIRGPGDVIGEMAPNRGRPRSASVFAIDTVEALYLSGDGWRDFLVAHPRAAIAQLGMAGDRMEEATRMTADASLSVEQRLAKVFVMMVDAGVGASADGDIVLRFGQQELANAVGASRESVVNTLRTFKDAGIAGTGRQSIVLYDLAALREVADATSSGSP